MPRANSPAPIRARVDIAAAAVELIHAYSLVHDDMPCMDDDVLRRGKPTCHVEYDEATALLVGDALQSLAFQLLAEHRLADDPAVQLEMVKLLAAASGSRGMAGGQAIDLAAIGKQPDAARTRIHAHPQDRRADPRRRAARRALRQRRSTRRQLGRLDHFAKCIGLAFQVVDDVLDTEAITATLGKTAGKDAQQNKPTYVSVLGVRRVEKTGRRAACARRWTRWTVSARARCACASWPISSCCESSDVRPAEHHQRSRRTCASWSASNCRNWPTSCASF